jgi:hypothetical protein
MNWVVFSDNPKCDLPERVNRHNFWILDSELPSLPLPIYFYVKGTVPNFISMWHCRKEKSRSVLCRIDSDRDCLSRRATVFVTAAAPGRQFNLIYQNIGATEHFHKEVRYMFETPNNTLDMEALWNGPRDHQTSRIWQFNCGIC